MSLAQCCCLYDIVVHGQVRIFIKIFPIVSLKLSKEMWIRINFGDYIIFHCIGGTTNTTRTYTHLDYDCDYIFSWFNCKIVYSPCMCEYSPSTNQVVLFHSKHFCVAHVDDVLIIYFNILHYISHMCWMKIKGPPFLTPLFYMSKWRRRQTFIIIFLIKRTNWLWHLLLGSLSKFDALTLLQLSRAK